MGKMMYMMYMMSAQLQNRLTRAKMMLVVMEMMLGRQAMMLGNRAILKATPTTPTTRTTFSLLFDTELFLMLTTIRPPPKQAGLSLASGKRED